MRGNNGTNANLFKFMEMLQKNTTQSAIFTPLHEDHFSSLGQFLPL